MKIWRATLIDRDFRGADGHRRDLAAERLEERRPGPGTDREDAHVGRQPEQWREQLLVCLVEGAGSGRAGDAPRERTRARLRERHDGVGDAPARGAFAVPAQPRAAGESFAPAWRGVPPVLRIRGVE